MSKETVFGVIRHILTFAGGILASRGIIDAGMVETISGAVITLGGVVWSIVEKRKAA
jgi:hypothetical protein